MMLVMINFYWAMVNLLPVWPLDGGWITRDLCGIISPRAGTLIALWISLVVSGLMCLNVVLLFTKSPSLPEFVGLDRNFGTFHAVIVLPDGGAVAFGSGFFTALLFGLFAVSCAAGDHERVENQPAAAPLRDDDDLPWALSRPDLLTKNVRASRNLSGEQSRPVRPARSVMPLTIACRCGQHYSVDEQYAGQGVPCSACGQIIHIAVPCKGRTSRLTVRGRRAGVVRRRGALVLTLLFVVVLGGGMAGIVWWLKYQGEQVAAVGETPQPPQKKDEPPAPPPPPRKKKETNSPGRGVRRSHNRSRRPNEQPKKLPPPSDRPWQGHLSSVLAVSIDRAGKHVWTASGGAMRRNVRHPTAPCPPGRRQRQGDGPHRAAESGIAAAAFDADGNAPPSPCRARRRSRLGISRRRRNSPRSTNTSSRCAAWRSPATAGGSSPAGTTSCSSSGIWVRTRRCTTQRAHQRRHRGRRLRGWEDGGDGRPGSHRPAVGSGEGRAEGRAERPRGHCLGDGALARRQARPDRRRLAAALADRVRRRGRGYEVRCWDVATTKEKKRGQPLAVAVTALAFSPDARRLPGRRQRRQPAAVAAGHEQGGQTPRRTQRRRRRCCLFR